MNFHIAFVLAILGAAQAGKDVDVMTFGSGLSNMAEPESGISSEDGDMGMASSSYAASVLNPSTTNTEHWTDVYGTKSLVHAKQAEADFELASQKQELATLFSRRSKEQATRANENYKKSQLHKRMSRDKETIAKEYDERAQKHDRISKDQDMKSEENRRRSNMEYREYGNSLSHAQQAMAHANSYRRLSQTEYNHASELENKAKELDAKAAELHKQAKEHKLKAQQDHEHSKIEHAKAREMMAKVAQLDHEINEENKKSRTIYYYAYEFKSKANTEQCQADYARGRSEIMAEMEQEEKDHASAVFLFANREKVNADICRRRAAESARQARMLTAAATHVLKNHRSINTQIYGKHGYHETL